MTSKLNFLTLTLLLALLVACSSNQVITNKEEYKTSVSKTLADSKKEITECEEIYAKNDDFAKTPESVVKLDLFLNSDGTAQNVTLVDKDITHEDVKECMLRKIKNIKFAKHNFGETVEVRATLTIKKLTHNHKGRNTKAFWPN